MLVANHKDAVQEATTMKMNDLRQDEYRQPDEYWNEIPDYPVEDWALEVIGHDTRLGYHDWAKNRAEQRPCSEHGA